MMRLFIGTPSHKGDPRVCVDWVTRLVQRLGIDLSAQVSIVAQCPWLDIARSLLVQEFLASDCTHLLFRDDDIEFEPETLRTLLTTKAPLACIPYRMRLAPHEWAVAAIGDQFYPGLGCALIERSVLERLVALYPELAYEQDGKTLHAFFLHTFIEDGGKRRLLKEDHAFWHRCHGIGAHVQLLPGRVVHAGVESLFH
jgi:hypothetical protein